MILDRPADLSLVLAHEKLRLLLGEDAPADEEWSIFPFEESAKRVQEIVERLRGMVHAAKERVRQHKELTATFFRKIRDIQLAEFILSHLTCFDIHAVLTRIRHIIGDHASIRVPLFEYGPELSEYRHRIR